MEQKLKNQNEQFQRLKDELGFEVYKINSINNSKNIVLFDVEKKYFYFEIDLLRVFDIIKDKEPFRFIRYFKDFFISREDDMIVKNIEHLLNLKDLFKVKEFLVSYQKDFFKAFRFKVIPLMVSCDMLSFYPIDQRIFNNKGIKELNIYCKEYRLTKPKIKNFEKYEFKHIEFLLKNIFQEGYNKFIDLLAWKKQNPLELIPSHWIIQDNGGTGKSEILIDFILTRLFNIEIIMQEDLESSFNGYIKNSEFLVCEEIEGYSNEKKMKVLTGAKYLTINDKYSKTFKIRNYNNIIIFTNDIKGLKISYGDRRFNVVGGGKRLSPLKEGEWSETLFESREENLRFFREFHKLIEVELWNFEQYLLNKKVDRLKIQIPIDNTKKLEMQKLNSTSEFEFLDELFELGFESFIAEYSSYDFTKFLVEEIFTEKNLNPEYNRACVSSKAIYKLYTEYCKYSNLKIISKNHFSRRIKQSPMFFEIFEDIDLVYKANDERLRAYIFQPKFKPNT